MSAFTTQSRGMCSRRRWRPVARAIDLGIGCHGDRMFRGDYREVIPYNRLPICQAKELRFNFRGKSLDEFATEYCSNTGPARTAQASAPIWPIPKMVAPKQADGRDPWCRTSTSGLVLLVTLHDYGRRCSRRR